MYERKPLSAKMAHFGPLNGRLRKSTEEGLEQDFNTLDAQREAAAAFILSQRHEGWVAVPVRSNPSPTHHAMPCNAKAEVQGS